MRLKPYTIESEKEFIKGIGAHSESNLLNIYTKEQLLKKYIDALKKRKDWTVLDKYEVIDYANKVLGKKVKEILIG